MGASRAVAIVIVALLAAGCGVARAVVVDPAADVRLAGEVWKSLRAKSPDAVALVDVDVVESTVYLTGRVDTEGEKIFAEAAAWRVDGVRQVVNDLQVAEDAAVAALPAASVRHPVLEHLPGVARIEQVPGGPAAVYDARGRLVATVYIVPVRELTGRGLEGLRAPQAINHVAIYLAGSHPDVPLPHYHVVLWHVSQSEAAALR
jgi:BON domain